jgi:Flp pilus assembly protein TadD
MPKTPTHRRALIAAHGSLVLLAATYFKAVKLLDVAAEVDLAPWVWIAAFAQDLAVVAIWIGLMAATARHIGPRVGQGLSLAGWAAATLAEIALIAYANFNLHYFSLFGIPLNLEALSDVDRLTDFAGSAEPFLRNPNSYVALGLMAVAALLPAALRWPGAGRGLDRLGELGGRLASRGHGLPLAGAILVILVWVPVDRHELAKNDIVELLSSVARIASERLGTPPTDLPELGGARVRLASLAYPDEQISPPADLLRFADRVREANAERPLNLLIVLLESMVSLKVAERIGILDVMPYLVGLQRESVVFDDYSTTFPLSMKSQLNLFCSTLPSPKRVTLTRINPRLDCRSVSEVATEHGYRAGLFHSGKFAFSVKDLFYADRGFEVMVDADNNPSREQFRSDYWGIEEAATLERMWSWLDEVGEGPFLGIYIPVAGHDPYHVWDPEHERYGTETRLQRYKNALGYVDDTVKGLMAELERRGLADDTLVVLVGDHGEALDLHPNNSIHGAEVYEENVQTLAYLHHPTLTKEALRYPHPVQHLDMMPTLYDLLGWEVPERYEGVSLLRPYPRKMALHYTVRSKKLGALRDGDIKVILNLRSDRVAAFDLAADPAEQDDVSDRHPGLIAHTREFFKSFISQRAAYLENYPIKEDSGGLPRLIREKVDAAAAGASDKEEHLARARALMAEGHPLAYAEAETELLRALSLGPDDFVVLRTLMRVYDRWGAFLQPAAHEFPPDQKAGRLGMAAHVYALKTHMERSALSEAQAAELEGTIIWHSVSRRKKSRSRVRRLRALLAERPDDPEVLGLLGRLLNAPRDSKRLLRKQTAVEPLVDALGAHARENPKDWFVGEQYLRLVADRLKSPEEAIAALGGELPTRPGNVAALQAWGHLLYKRGLFSRAVPILQRAADVGREQGLTIMLHYVESRLGASLLLIGRAAEAKGHYEKALEIHPGSARSLSGLAIIAMRSGDLEEARALLARAAERPTSSQIWQRCAQGELKGIEGDYVGAVATVGRTKARWPVVQHECRFAAAMAAGRPDQAENWLRSTLEANPLDPVRFKRLSVLSKAVKTAFPRSKLPTHVAGLRAEHALTWPAKNLWSRALAAKKLHMPSRAGRLAGEYLATVPDGKHAAEARQLVDAASAEVVEGGQ